MHRCLVVDWLIGQHVRLERDTKKHMIRICLSYEQHVHYVEKVTLYVS